MDTELNHIEKRLREEGDRTVAFFQALSDSEWEMLVYSGKISWRVRDVLGHFISAERAYQNYLAEILAGGPGVPPDLDIDKFNAIEVEGFSEWEEEALLKAYQGTRKETIRLVASLELDDLKLRVVHPWSGERDLSWFLKLLYRHQLMHIHDIKRVLKKD